DVLLTIRYYRLLREYTEALVSGKDTTRILNQLRQIAEETRRSDLIEQTEKLGSDKKADLSEVTKKMRS
ncbi:VWA domain-containing protein, partial [Sulfolobus sp. E3]